MAGAVESVGLGNRNIASVVNGEHGLSANEISDLTAKFKSLVDGAKVLDGNIIFDQGSNKLMRVSYGNSFRRWCHASTQGRVATAQENIATRRLFGTTMSARINQLERAGSISRESATRLRGLIDRLGDNQENAKPLSRRMISQVMTSIDEAVDARANGNEMSENNRPRLGTWKSTPWKLVGSGDNGVRLSQRQYEGMFNDAMLAIKKEILPRLPEDQRPGDLLDRVKVQIERFKDLYSQGNNFGELENILQGGLDATSIGERILQRLNVRIAEEQFNAPAQEVQQEQNLQEEQNLQQEQNVQQEQIPQEQIQQEQVPPEQIQQEQVQQEQIQQEQVPPEIPQDRVIKHEGVVSENTFQKLNALWKAEETSGANELGAKVDLGKLRSAEEEKAKKLCGDDPRKLANYKSFRAERNFISNFVFDSFVGNMVRGRNDGERLVIHLMENADAALSCLRDLRQMDGDGAKPGWYAALEKNAPELLDVFKNFLGVVSENVDVTPQTTAIGFQNLVFAKRKEICKKLPQLEEAIDVAAKTMVDRVADGLVTKIGHLCTPDVRTKIDLVVLRRLMTDATPDDRRRLLAAGLREDGTNNPSAGWGDVSTLCGLVRGMGVYANKILQGLPLLQESAIEDKSLKQLRAAVADARNSLPPIDETMLKAELYNAVAGKEGGADIKGIEVHAVLGAGSVAETLACTITREVDDPNGGGGKIMQKDDVIVKVLRPDIKQSFDRQAEIVKQLIEHPGQDISVADKAILEGSYHSRVTAFAEECDSRRELLNALRGARTFGRPLDQKGENEKTLTVKYTVGGKEFSFAEKNTVGSEGLILKPESSGPEHADEIAAAINGAQDDDALNEVLDKYFVTGNDTCFIIERAQGTDIQKLNGAFKERQAKGFGISPEAGRDERLQALKDERKPFIALNRSLAQLKESFIKSALFGREHFFHCDLTAGNLVYDPKTGALTVIDYGKAAVLSDAEAEALAMVQELECNRGAAANGAVMLRAYRKLLAAETARCEQLGRRNDLDGFTRQENAEYLKQLKDAAKQLDTLGAPEAETLFEDILAKLKNENDPRASSTFGAFATVVSEVGRFLEDVYLPIPSAVQNFVDTYVRLQNTIADVQGNIRALDGEMNAVLRNSALEKIDGKLATIEKLKTPLEQLGSLELRLEPEEEEYSDPYSDKGENDIAYRYVVHICEAKTEVRSDVADVKTFTARLGDLRQQLAKASTLTERRKAMNALLALVSAEETRLMDFRDDVLSGSLLTRIKCRIANTEFKSRSNENGKVGTAPMDIRFVDDCRETLAGGRAKDLPKGMGLLNFDGEVAEGMEVDGLVWQGLAQLKELRETLQQELNAVNGVSESNAVHANGLESQMLSGLTEGELDVDDTAVLHANIQQEDFVFNRFVETMTLHWGKFSEGEKLLPPDSCMRDFMKKEIRGDGTWYTTLCNTLDTLNGGENLQTLNAMAACSLCDFEHTDENKAHFDLDSTDVRGEYYEKYVELSDLERMAPADGELLNAFKELLAVSGVADRVRIPEKPSVKNLCDAIDALAGALCTVVKGDDPLFGKALEVFNRLCEVTMRLPFKKDILAREPGQPTFATFEMDLEYFKTMVAYSSRNVIDANGKTCEDVSEFKEKTATTKHIPLFYKLVTGQELPAGKPLTVIDCKRLIDTYIDKCGATGMQFEGEFHLDDCDQTPITPQQMEKFRKLLKAAEDLQLDVSEWKTSGGDVPEHVSVKAYHRLCSELRAVYDACEPRTDDDTVLVKTILAEAAKAGGKFKGLGDDKDVGRQYQAFGVPPKDDMPRCPDGLEGTYFALTRFVKTEKQQQYAEQADAVQARNARILKNHLRQLQLPLENNGAMSVDGYREAQKEFEREYDEKLKVCFSHVLKFISSGEKYSLRARDPFFDVLRSLATELEEVKEEMRPVVKTEWADLSKLTDQQKAILTEAAVRLELWKSDSLRRGVKVDFLKSSGEKAGAVKRGGAVVKMEGEVLSEDELKGIRKNRLKNEALGKARTEARKTLSGCRQLNDDVRAEFSSSLDKAETPEKCAKIAEEARKADGEALAAAEKRLVDEARVVLQRRVDDMKDEKEKVTKHFKDSLGELKTVDDVVKWERIVFGYADFKEEVGLLQNAMPGIADGNLKQSLLADLDKTFDAFELPGLRRKVALGELLAAYKERIEKLSDHPARQNCQSFREGVMTEEGLETLCKMVVDAETKAGIARPDSVLENQPSPNLDLDVQYQNGTLKSVAPSTRKDVIYRQGPNLNTGFLLAVVNGLARTDVGNDYLQNFDSNGGFVFGYAQYRPSGQAGDEETSSFENAFLECYATTDGNEMFDRRLKRGVGQPIDEALAAQCIGLKVEHKAKPLKPGDGDFGSEGKLAKFVKVELEQDHVLTLDFGSGHYCTLVGYNADSGEFMLADPSESDVRARYKGLTYDQLVLQGVRLSSFAI